MRWLGVLAACLTLGPAGCIPLPEVGDEGQACFDDGTCLEGLRCYLEACCASDCEGKECGAEDGCGGLCAGPCPAGQWCQAQACVACDSGAHCGPDCLDCAAAPEGHACVDQACGCLGEADCAAGLTCAEGRCVACAPACAGRQCGPDGCDGSCGACPAGEECNLETGRCQAGGEAPRLLFEDVSGQTLPAGTHWQEFHLQFSEPVRGVGPEGLALSGGAFLASATTLDRQGWTLEVAGLRQGASFRLQLLDRIQDLAGNALPAAQLDFAVAAGPVIYLREGGTGDGSSPDQPSGDLVAALVAATEGTELWLAQGRFETFTELSRGVSMFCGFNATFTQRDPALYTTVVSQDMLYAHTTLVGAEGAVVRALDGCSLINEFGGGAGLQPAVGLELIGASPLVTRNRILTAGSDDSLGVRVNGGSPVLLGNDIESAGVPLGVLHVGVSLLGPGAARVVANRIAGGDGPGSATALASVEQDALIAGNHLFGGGDTGTGQDNRSVGVAITGGAPRVWNNLIHAGGRRASSVGVLLEGTRALLVHNTVYAGQATLRADAMRCAADAHPALANNILFCGTPEGRGLVEEGATSDPASFQNNLLAACPGGLYLDEGVTRLDLPAAIDALDGGALEDSACPGGAGCEHGRASATLTTALTPAQLFVDQAGPDGDPGSALDFDWHLATRDPTLLGGAKSTFGQDCGSLESPVSCGQVGLDLDGALRVLPGPPGAYASPAP